MKRRTTQSGGIVNTALGLAAGAAAGIALNSVAPKTGGMTTTIVNAVKLIGGVYFAATQKTAMTRNIALGLAAEGAGEIVAQYAGGDSEGYTGPSIFGFPTVYTPSYQLPYMQGVGALGDAGVTSGVAY